MGVEVHNSWHGDALKSLIRRNQVLKMEEACKYFIKQTQQLLTAHKFPPKAALGQPPAMRTGTLANSLVYEVKEDGHLVVGEIKSTLPFAPAIERTHPFIAPTLEREGENIAAILGQKMN